MNKAGTWIKNLNKNTEYKSFRPTLLKDLLPFELDSEANLLLNEANKELGTLNGLSKSVNDYNIFLSSYVRKEALLSSQIEGTQATLDDVFNEEDTANANLEVIDVINYVNAVNYSVELLKELPLSSRFIRRIHEVLMAKVRGQDKNPGEFRNSQNWIGPSNSNIKNAKYIPPNVSDMKDAINDLEIFINEEDSDLNPLVKAALIHYQFETIHPFLDGNGRVGRILITLYLISCGFIRQPILYLSLYLKTNQIEYYQQLNDVRRTGNYLNWIKFFLKGVIETSLNSANTITLLRELRAKNIEVIKAKDVWLLDYIEKHPIIDATKTAKDIAISYPSINRTIQRFIDLGILKINNNSKRARSYSYKEYIEILKQDI